VYRDSHVQSYNLVVDCFKKINLVVEFGEVPCFYLYCCYTVDVLIYAILLARSCIFVLH